MIYIKCQQCDKQIENNRRKFCSPRCYHKYHSRKSYLLHKDEVIERSKKYHKNPKYIEYVKNQLKTLEYKDYMRKHREGWKKTSKGIQSLKEAKRRYDQTDKGKEATKRWLNSDNWKNYLKEYMNNPINKKRLDDWKKDWARTEEGKKRLRDADKRYFQTEHGKMSVRLRCSRRRLRKKQLVEKFSKQEWIDKLKGTNGFCNRCRKQIGINNLTLDHIIPISSGLKKEYFIDDIQPLCKSCNSSKGDKIIESSYV